MLKAFKYRLYPNDEQKALLAKQFGHCRWVYNWGLRIKQDAFKATGKSPSKFDLANQLPGLKKETATEWLKEAGSQSLQAALEHLDTAYNNFFAKRADYPTFKSKHDSKQSYTIPSGVEVVWDQGRVWLPKFKESLVVKLSRKYEGATRKATVSRNASGEYYISIIVETGAEAPVKPKLESKDDVLGVDVGLKDFAITSEGEVVDNPKYLKHASKRLALLQKRQSHKVKGSKNRNKARVLVARCHQKISDKRTDFLHKLSSRLVGENKAVAREDLNVAGMLKNHKLAKGISDVSWSQFDTFLTYKCEWYGKWFLQIGRFEASSKTCNVCSYVKRDLTLADRKWYCPVCKVWHDRDVNAAKNMSSWAYIAWQREQEIPTGGGESKSVSPPGDIQRKPKRKGVGEVPVGQKGVARAPQNPRPFRVG
jgi:putative transposase